jgi:hypothetical protein
VLSRNSSRGIKSENNSLRILRSAVEMRTGYVQNRLTGVQRNHCTNIFFFCKFDYVELVVCVCVSIHSTTTTIFCSTKCT